jgi:DNA-binding response OmpR family regulator
MNLLVAEDEPLSRLALSASLAEAGFRVTAAGDGQEALRILLGPDPPKLAILDWVMPKLDGLQVIRRIRAVPSDDPPYLIVLTAKEGLKNILVALENGANDYMTKPHNHRELLSRVRVGSRVVQLQAELARRAREAETALHHIKRLQGLLPICAYCKKIRNDGDYWQEIEDYLHEHTQADFTHGICPDCYHHLIEPCGAEPAE